MANYIPCFIHDEAFHNIADGKIQTIETLASQGMGFFTQKLRTFFVNPSMFVDSRATRRTVHEKLALGDIEIHFDEAAETADPAFYSAISALETAHFYNIVEFAIFSNPDGYTVTDIQQGLVGDSNFDGYDGGFTRSETSSTVVVHRGDGDVSIKVPDWIEFNFQINNNDSVITRTFRLWLKQSLFATDYPITTIDNDGVFYPMSEADMQDLTWTNSQTAALDAANTVLSAITSATATNLYSGVKTVTVGHSANITLPFGIAYKGPVPTDAECYTAIGFKLAGDVPEEITLWSGYFPTLFSVNKYFVVPFWTNRATLLNVIYDLGMMDYAKMDAKINELYSFHINTSDVTDVIRIPGSRLPAIVFPDPDNGELPSLSTTATFASYTGTDSTNDGSYTAQSVPSQDLCKRLARSIAMMQSAATSDATLGITTTTVSGKAYFQFKVSNVVFYVLKSTNFGA
jgi:hypothetical protein